MTSFEPVQAGPYLAPSDPPDLANISKLIVDWAALRSNMRFASTAARDAAIPAPVEGMECVTGTGAAMVKWRYVSAAWALLTDLIDPSWATYIPVWTSSGTAPALGNGVLTGAYKQVGKTVNFRISFTPGSTSTFGTGAYRWSLPVATSTPIQPYGIARATNAGVASYQGGVVTGGSGVVAIELPTSATNNGLVAVGQLAPWTVKANDVFTFGGTYQAI